MTPRLRRQDILRVLDKAAAITHQDRIVIVGSAAAVLALRSVPLDMCYTPDVDVYVPDDSIVQQASDTIDFVIGEGSTFHEENGFFAHGVDHNTSCMPDDWMGRATLITVRDHPPVTCVCPDIQDIALSKVCAWREKDREWLKVAYESGILDDRLMLTRAASVSNKSAPPVADIRDRIDRIAGLARGVGAPGHSMGR